MFAKSARGMARGCDSLPRQKEDMPEQSPSQPAYAALRLNIKQRIQTAQVRAAAAVNQDLVWLHWEIGREIWARQKVEGWGQR
jgi:hypothetical protein